MTSKLYGISIRRGFLLVLWDANEACFRLPFCDISLQENNFPAEHHTAFFHSAFHSLTGIELETSGAWMQLSSAASASSPSPQLPETDRAFWSYLVFYAPPEMNFDGRVSAKGLAWLPVSKILQDFSVAEDVRQFVTQHLNDPGNSYTRVTTVGGIPTFAHLATGEILHSQQGPFEEAELLYIEPCSIRTATGEYSIFDCGLGCGTLVLAACNAFLENDQLTKLHVVSFDLEKNGLLSLLRDIDSFPLAQPHRNLIEKMLTNDLFECDLAPGKKFVFQFEKGDFSKVIKQNTHAFPKADAVFYDFFSPRNHPDLWHLDVILALKEHCKAHCLLATYSSATAVRAVFAAAGFFVGEGAPSGKKNGTTLVSPSLEKLGKPLPASFAGTFQRSQAAYLPNVDDVVKSRIALSLQCHPQFQA